MTNDRNNNQGNFAQNPERAREAGKKGGEMSQGGQNKQQDKNKTGDRNQ